ncbi:MAG TPA: recombinase family protein [Planctomycetota bacterium]|nr:recombinase family protein [Planctomycetota bacterium]
MPNAVAYSRVSTDSQSETGLGLHAQRTAIDAAARRLGVDVASWHENAGVSGSTSAEERVGLMAAIGNLRRGDVLLVAKRDRLGRDVVNVALVERLVERKGARIVSAAGEGTDSAEPTALLMRRIVDAFAEYERLLIGARTKAALRAKRGRGERAGNVPFGYVADAAGRLTAHADEQRVLSFMRERRTAGDSLRADAAALDAAGVRPRGGGRWYAETVRSALAHSAAGAA